MRARRHLIEALELRRLLSIAPVADIDSQFLHSSMPDNLTSFNGALYFTSNTSINGLGATSNGLWRYDPASGQSLHLANDYGQLSVAGGKLFCSSSNGYFIVTDGTLAGTYQLNTSGNPTSIATLNNRLVFQSGSGLYITDGSPAGTVQLSGLAALPNSAGISAGNMTFFSVFDSPSNSYRLWHTNGTPAGSSAIGTFPGGFPAPSGFTALGSVAYFSANDGVSGSELWRSDGSDTGNHIVKDLVPGAGSSSPKLLGTLNNKLIFGASGSAQGIWSSNGTDGGTVQLSASQIPSGSFVSFGGSIYFGATTSGGVPQLWRTNGTVAGTQLVQTFASAAGAPTNLAVAGTTVYFSMSDSTGHVTEWRSDGTAANTALVDAITPSGDYAVFTAPAAIGSTLYYGGSAPGRFDEIRQVTGTSPSSFTVDVTPFTGPSNPNATVEINGVHFFFANDAVHGFELWRSDGTSAGTSLVKDINPGPDSSAPNLHDGFDVQFEPYTGGAPHIGTVNNKLIFEAFDGSTYGLYASDGTAAGTICLAQFTASDPVAENYFTDGGTLYFGTSSDLWKTDGTVAGTSMISSGCMEPGQVPFFTRLGNRIYFSGATAFINGSAVSTLWSTDGTPEGTVAVNLALEPGHTLTVYALTALNGRLYFGGTDNFPSLYGYDPVAGLSIVSLGQSAPDIEVVAGKLWIAGGFSGVVVSDGTSAGTQTLTAGIGGSPTLIASYSWPRTGTGGEAIFTPLNGSVYFAALDANNDQQLFRSDGTSAGTTAITSFTSLPSSLASSYLGVPEIRAFDGKVYFFSSENNAGRLWSTDGTIANTAPVAGVQAAAVVDKPASFNQFGRAGFLGSVDSLGFWMYLDDPQYGIEPFFYGLAAFTGGSYQGSGNLILSSAQSVTPPGDAITLQWDLDNDGIFGETGAGATRGNETLANPTFAGGTTANTFPVTLRIIDSTLGLTATAMTMVTIAPLAGLSLGGASYTLSPSGGSTMLSITGGTPTLTSDLGANYPGVAVSVQPGTTLTIAATQHLGALSIAAGATTKLASGGSTVLVATSLAIGNGGVLDMNDDTLIVDYSGDSPFSTIQGLLTSGFNGGTWNGPGIDSLAAHNDSNLRHALGYAEASALGVTTYQGQPVDRTAVIVRYTKYGDNNLDGVVDIGNDFGLLIDGLSQHGSTWLQGDYTYDGKVDLGNDFNLFLRNYLSQASTPGVALPAAAARPFVAAVPVSPSLRPIDWDGGSASGLFDGDQSLN